MIMEAKKINADTTADAGLIDSLCGAITPTFLPIGSE